MMNWKKTADLLGHSLQYLFFAGVVVAISLLFPDNIRFKFRYQLGATWYYEDLVAPFDFAIRKTPTQLAADRAAVTQEFTPVYRRDDSLTARQVRRFDALFDAQVAAIEPPQFAGVRSQASVYRSFGRAFLARLLDRGVVQLAPEHRKARPNSAITILSADSMRQVPLGVLITRKNLADLLADSLARHPLPDVDFLYPILHELAIPNVAYDRELTESSEQQSVQAVGEYAGMVKKGELIVSRGGIVSEPIFQKLESLKANYEKEITERSAHWGILVGYFMLVCMMIGAYVLYLRSYHPRVFNHWNEIFFLFSAILLYPYLVFFVGKFEGLNLYLIPFGVVPIVIKTFYDNWLAFFTHLVIVLLASFLSPQGLEFTFLQLMVGMVVLLSRIDPRSWTHFFNSILFIFFAYALGYLGLGLIQRGNTASFDWSIYAWIGLSAFLHLLAFPLIPLLERVFGFTSAIALTELADLNRPLLQELATKAPGTFQHSLQVATLSEAAARRIGGNPLLVRVGALYHDIGKMANPEFFIENQTGQNPHTGLPYLESARIIIGHVIEGEKMARRHRLPKVIIDFILTHHGTTLVEYFYRHYLTSEPENPVDEKLFRYPGPRPVTKEASILLLADSIEAAAKASLRQPSTDDIRVLVEKIVAGKLAQGQLDESMLTFHELEKCKLEFSRILRSVYHHRIEYPTKP